MTEPKLQIDQRCDRIEEAIVTMAARMVDTSSGETFFSEKDYEKVKEILRDPSKPSFPQTAEMADATVQGEERGQDS